MTKRKATKNCSTCLWLSQKCYGFICAGADSKPVQGYSCAKFLIEIKVPQEYGTECGAHVTEEDAKKKPQLLAEILDLKEWDNE